MNHFSLLVKPTGADCNIRCEYCFYLEKAGLYPELKKHRMTSETLGEMIKSFMSTDQQQYAFGWQGGEPTLMGVDFFRQAVGFQKSFGRPGTVVANGLQTNGTLIDDEFAAFFSEYKFLIGVSLDGPESIHNIYRRDAAGKGTHARVIRGIDFLKKHNVEFNILVLVSQANVHRAREVYNYLKGLGFYHQQYIPCVEFDATGKLLPFAISGAEWGAFMCELFDEWKSSDSRRVSIRHFDSMLHMLVNRQHVQCSMSPHCNHYFVVEHNGDVYPCDFFVRPELKLGNVNTPNWNWSNAGRSEVYKEFGQRKLKHAPACKDCPHYQLCFGDCPKHRPLGAENMSHLCAGWKKFYSYSRKWFIDTARQIQAERAGISQPQPMRVGRNAPCPCGSGKKFKSCCGKNMPR